MPSTDASTERPGPDLRARRRRQTELEIHAAAVALAAERGADQVTVDDIAARAGVSARTFFRYFATRDRALVFDRWGFSDAVDELFVRADPNEVRLRDIEQAFGSVLANIDQSPDVGATADMYQAITSSPQLMAAATAAANERTDGLLATIPATARSRVRFMLAVAGTVLFAAFTEWIETGTPTGASGAPSVLDIYLRLCDELGTL
ncbi:TetR/AcrR family transcriptional regulator [Nocardia iowensis]|uniref:TetR family transcriptional regulator n=1 Tax=Nocardia iowensis TaxID=204891 RepID=A0ABX8RG31_NOCIO|nr:TetR/AcrR family transcriptional regulator [Nocardia iowensis]QXN88567.1 TetR family transcriptional regulator [Nocardia iowensis]